MYAHGKEIKAIHRTAERTAEESRIGKGNMRGQNGDEVKKKQDKLKELESKRKQMSTHNHDGV